MKEQNTEENNLNNNEENKSEDDIFSFSNESYKNQTIFDGNFMIVECPFENNYDKFSLFERKELALELFKERENNKNISIEEILQLDNTNKKIQCEYLKLAVENLCKEENPDKILVLKEKINKAGIICDEKDYNDIISQLPEKFKSDVAYINYKKNLIKSLQSILKREKEDQDFKNVDKILKSFNFKKKYEFNHECEAGENNYYFYSLVYQIVISDLQNKLYYFDLYRLCINKIIDFINTYDYSNPKDIDMNYFEFLFNLFTDNKVIKLKSKKGKLIENYINSYEKKFSEKIDIGEKQINEFNGYFENFMDKDDKTDYKIFVENGKINVNIIDRPKINRKEKYFQKKYEYDINMFNEDVLKIIKNDLTQDNYHNFESIFLRNVRYGMEYKPNEQYMNKFKEVLTKILKSEAAKKYFIEFYKNKNNKLDYHFDKKKVIDEIFNRIKFCMLFKDGDQAYTSPVELKIYINCVAGEYDSFEINNFERKILQFSRLMTITVHEVMGHFLRRYYAYLTNHLVKFETQEDKVFKTGKEGGKFVEYNFLGIDKNNSSLSLSLNDAIGFFKNDFKNYPILYTDLVPKDDLIVIINNNPDYFDFISEFGKQKTSISLEELHAYLLKGFTIPPRIHCGNRRENVIYIEHPYFLN